MSIFVLTGLLLSREDRFFHLEPSLQNHNVKPEVAVNINECLVEKKYAVLLIDAP